MNTESLHPLCQTVLSFIDEHSFADRQIIIAYSGGVDSQVLIHILSTLSRKKLINNPVKAIHVHHGLSPNADAWAEFTKSQAENWSVDYISARVILKKAKQTSIEALARDARYQELEKLSNTDAVIVTGHHLDDQLETMLLALKRGSGVQGLASMQAWRNFRDSRTLARPLLSVDQQQIIEYAQHHKLQWVEDESNNDQYYDRNFLRNSIISKLKARWPQLPEMAGRTSQHLQESQVLLDELAEQDINKAIIVDSGFTEKSHPIGNQVLSIETLKQLSDARVKNAIRFYLKSLQLLMPSTKQLEQIIQLIHAGQDKTPNVQLADRVIRRYKDGLFITKTFADVSDFQQQIQLAELNQQTFISLPDQLGQISLQILGQSNKNDELLSGNSSTVFLELNEQQAINISFAHNNPSLRPEYRDKARPLKKILQELHIPTWQRKRIPFVSFDNDFVAALSLFVCKGYVAKDKSKCLAITWHQNR